MKTAQQNSRRWSAIGPVLACGDTNAAVDNLVEGLVKKGMRVVRLGQPAKVRRYNGRGAPAAAVARFGSWSDLGIHAKRLLRCVPCVMPQGFDVLVLLPAGSF